MQSSTVLVNQGRATTTRRDAGLWHARRALPIVATRLVHGSGLIVIVVVVAIVLPLPTTDRRLGPGTGADLGICGRAAAGGGDAGALDIHVGPSVRAVIAAGVDAIRGGIAGAGLSADIDA